MASTKTKFLKRMRGWIENAISIFNTIKRLTDLTEDTISTLRVAGILASMSEPLIRGVIGGLNLLNVYFELFTSIYDLIKAYASKQRFRLTHMTTAGLRAGFAAAGMLISILYLANVLLLPFALVGISAAVLPIFITTVLKDIYLHYKAKDQKEFLETERELAFSTIEMLAYLLIAVGSILSLVIFFNPAVLPAASIAALAVTVIGVTITTSAKIFQLVDNHYENKISAAIREFFANLFVVREKSKPTPAQIVQETPQNDKNAEPEISSTTLHLHKQLHAELLNHATHYSKPVKKPVKKFTPPTKKASPIPAKKASPVSPKKISAEKRGLTSSAPTLYRAHMPTKTCRQEAAISHHMMPQNNLSLLTS